MYNAKKDDPIIAITSININAIIRLAGIFKKFLFSLILSNLCLVTCYIVHALTRNENIIFLIIIPPFSITPFHILHKKIICRACLNRMVT